MSQQRGGDRTDALLRPFGSHQAVGGVAESDDLGSNRQRIEPLGEVATRYLNVGLIAAVGDRANKISFSRRNRPSTSSPRMSEVERHAAVSSHVDGRRKRGRQLRRPHKERRIRVPSPLIPQRQDHQMLIPNCASPVAIRWRSVELAEARDHLGRAPVP